MSKQSIIIAVDIETSGCQLIKNGIVSIGYVVGERYDQPSSCISGLVLAKIYEKGRISLQLPKEKEFEKRCLEQFWNKHQDKLQQFQKEAVSEKEGIIKFIDIVDKYEEKYNITILSDNPSFDIAFLNYYLEFYLNRRPLSYTKTGEYRGVYDIDELVRKLVSQKRTRWAYDNEAIRIMCRNISHTHDHWPENDAENILIRVLKITEYLCE